MSSPAETELRSLAEKAGVNVTVLEEEYRQLISRLRNDDLVLKLLSAKYRVRTQRAVPVVFTGNGLERMDVIYADGSLPALGDTISANGKLLGIVVGYASSVRSEEPETVSKDGTVDLVERFATMLDTTLENVEDGVDVASIVMISPDRVTPDGIIRTAVRRFEKSGNLQVKCYIPHGEERPETVFVEFPRPVAEALYLNENVLRVWQETGTPLLVIGQTGTRSFEGSSGETVKVRKIRAYCFVPVIVPDLNAVEPLAGEKGYFPLGVLLATGFTRESLEKWAKENKRIGIARIKDTGEEVFDFTPLESGG